MHCGLLIAWASEAGRTLGGVSEAGALEAYAELLRSVGVHESQPALARDVAVPGRWSYDTWIQ
jgi:hypothetical protein